MNQLALALVISTLAAGCSLGTMSPRARFSESAYTLNDAARWGQVEIAVSHVAAPYQERFRERRRDWGERINVAEVELLNMRLNEDKQGGLSEVSVSWYENSTLVLHRSVIAQRWTRERGAFRLVDEVIAKGDRGVFAE